jgi:hypothetical protein
MGLNEYDKFKEFFFQIRKGLQQGVKEKIVELKMNIDNEECKKDRL